MDPRQLSVRDARWPQLSEHLIGRHHRAGERQGHLAAWGRHRYLASGNILLFDNGPYRLDNSRPFSRVLEIDPASKKIVWSYQDRPFFTFFSDRISNAQRLPKGNTLIDEGVFGRFFEVTPDGAVVWEYVNPHFGPTTLGDTNQVFRVYRYSAEEIGRARATGTSAASTR